MKIFFGIVQGFKSFPKSRNNQKCLAKEVFEFRKSKLRTVSHYLIYNAPCPGFSFESEMFS